jgi:GNAT superfamily N-acetyltransferase
MAYPELIVRPWTPSDAPAVAALLDAGADPLWVAQGHSAHGPDWHQGQRWRRTLVAHDADRLVGAATIATNRVHAGRLSCAVEVGAPWRRCGVGRRLLAEVRSLASQAVPTAVLSVKVRPGSAAHAFATAAGAAVYQQCPGIRVDAQDPALPEWCAAVGTDGTDHAADVVSVTTLTQVSRRQVEAAFVEQYSWVHRGWAPVSSSQSLREVAATTIDELDRELSTGAWMGYRLVATAFAFRAGDALEVVAEAQSPAEPLAMYAVAQVVAGSLVRAAAAGIRQVDFDGHLSDPHLMPVLASLPHSGTAPLLLMELCC